MAIDWSDEFLADVVIPDHDCPPARCTPDEWLAEAATLDHLSDAFGTVITDRARQQLKVSHGRHRGKAEVELAIRSCGTIAKAAAELGMTELEAASTLTRSAVDGPLALEIESALTFNPEMTYADIARLLDLRGRGVDCPDQYVARFAAVFGLERRGTRDGHLTRAQLAAVEARVAAGESMRQVARELGVCGSTISRALRRRAA